MQDLRLVGVHDDGEHLLLSGAGSEMFRLPLDEALRAASRPVAKSPTRSAPVALSPRDIQARIRAGATATEVSELSGIPLAKVERYEGPVLAERDHIAQQARKVEVAAPLAGQDSYRSAFGDEPASLDEMVSHRLSAYGVDPATVEWDSWRLPDGTWAVVARFEDTSEHQSAIGEAPPARWVFSPLRKSLQNANRWAQQLSELEPLDGPLPSRRLSAVSDQPFDFESDAATKSPDGTPTASQVSVPTPEDDVASAADADGLLDMLRSRRGQRLGTDEDGDDALALLLTNGVPAAHPRPSEHPDVVQEEQNSPAATGGPESRSDSTETAERERRPSTGSRLSLIPPLRDSSDDSLRLHDGVSTETREVTIQAAPTPRENPSGAEAPARPLSGKPRSSGRSGLNELLGYGRPRTDTSEGSGEDDAASDAKTPERQPSKPKRSSVPSWDDIVFGTRGD
ncbi:septation protein SepH [Pseudarthrobacter sp. PS3-L1]|uniref:septation protein SepH n=1 Tax=Pseudarthrobacter sp. PS3-L1 TaxID=3046207 RepID=UPI0024B9EE0E|nr:septation protein SepH [Pseudarthrobacter sp. PS3-L1]MDJ0320327.1 septation protein SepH [Pseudarthrobacter sp. PS3-L1]